MRHPFVAVALAAAVLRLACGEAGGHDVYTQLRNHVGQLCCGGDPDTGDCEPLEADQFKVLANGDVLVQSRRYNASLLVSSIKVTWLPVAGSAAPAHWCGVPRTKVYLAPVNAENPDPGFWTYCAFIAPGGV